MSNEHEARNLYTDLLEWLESNLGRRSLAPLTGTDTRALASAVHILEQYAYDRHGILLRAFGDVVARMQPHTQYLAYHAIAKVMDWSDRAKLWQMSGLKPLENRGRCAFEPGGSHQDQRDEAA